MDLQKQFFEQAYKTGSDLWTPINKTIELKNLLHVLPKDAMILDIGCGRGRADFGLVDLGYKVIGLDYVKDIVDNNNDEAKTRNVLERVRFIEGDAEDIPFTDSSFDAVLDIGTSHHFNKEKFLTYTKEVSRIVKQGGYFFFVGLSSQTPKYLTFLPAQSDDHGFNYHGVDYHFFSKEELQTFFGETFDILNIETIEMGEKEKGLYHVALMKRR